MKKKLALLWTIVMLVIIICGCSKPTRLPDIDDSTTETSVTAETPTANLGMARERLNVDTTEESKKYGGTLRLNYNAPTNSLDPAQFYTNNNTTPGYHIYESPVQLDEAGSIWPLVCEYESSNGGKTLTLKVRENIKFHNGDTVDAYDVEASIARSINWNEKMQKNFGEYLVKTEVPDDMTVVYFFKELPPLALMSMGEVNGGCKIMPKMIIDKLGSDGLVTADEDIIGTGPYKLGTWVRDISLELVRFEDYVPYESEGTGPAAPKKGYFDSIYWSVASDAMARTTGVLAGEFHSTSSVVPDMEKQLLDSGLTLDINWNGWSPTIMFNLSKYNSDSIVQDVNFRKAVLACLDMNAFLPVFGRPTEFYRVDSCIVPVTSVYYNNILPHDNNNYDLEKAKEYLEASGYNGETITWICADSDSYYKLSLPASQMLEKIGVKVDLQVHEIATYEQEYIDPKADFDICARENQKPALNPMLSDRYVSGNITGWWESEVRTTALKKLSSTESGSQESIAAFTEFCEAVRDEVPYIICIEFGTPSYSAPNLIHDKAGIHAYWWNSYFNDND